MLDSLQLTADYPVATPVNWTDGDDVIIAPAVTDEDAKAKFPKGFKSQGLPALHPAAQQVALLIVGPRPTGAERRGRSPGGCGLCAVPIRCPTGRP